MTRYFYLCLFAICGVVLATPRLAYAHNAGITSDEGWAFTGPAGCTACHQGLVGSAPTIVAFSNSAGSLFTSSGTLAGTAGVADKYSITLDIGDRAAAGINVTPTSGTLALCASATAGDACDLRAPVTSLKTGAALSIPYVPQITHKAKHPKDASNQVTFSFDYTPSATACSVELIIWINGVDGTGGTTNDHPASFTYTITSAGATSTDSCAPGGACDPALFLASGTACSDGSLCSQTDTCQAGACIGSNPIFCAAPGSCQQIGMCAPATGICAFPPKTDGTACNDGNACTQTDACLAGVCAGGNNVVCPAPAACHDQGSCDTTTGVCSTPGSPDGTMCDDGNACTMTDTCQAAVCTGGSAVVCSTPDDCHDAGVCDPALGCSNTTKADGTSCDDGNACTLADTCMLGICTSGATKVCTPTDDCHDSVCDATSGDCGSTSKANGTTCSDGNACTQTDTCQLGVCTGTPVNCVPSDDCHDSTCDMGTGTCSSTTKVDGTVCSVGTCVAGVCTPDNVSTGATTTSAASTSAVTTGNGGAGNGATTGAGSGGAGTGGAGGPSVPEGGCGCRVAESPHESDERGFAALALMVGAALVSRRRR